MNTRLTSFIGFGKGPRRSPPGPVLAPSVTGTLATGETLTGVGGTRYGEVIARRWRTRVQPSGTITITGETGPTFAVSDPPAFDDISYGEQDSNGFWHDSAWYALIVPPEEALYSIDFSDPVFGGDDFFLSEFHGDGTPTSQGVEGWDFRGYDYGGPPPFSEYLGIRGGKLRQLANSLGTGGFIAYPVDTPIYEVRYTLTGEPGGAGQKRIPIVLAGYEVSEYNQDLILALIRMDDPEQLTVYGDGIGSLGTIIGATNVDWADGDVVSFRVNLTDGEIRVSRNGVQVAEGSFTPDSFNDSGRSQCFGIAPSFVENYPVGADLLDKIALFEPGALEIPVLVVQDGEGTPAPLVLNISGTDTHVDTTAVHYRIEVETTPGNWVVARNWASAAFADGEYEADYQPPQYQWGGKRVKVFVRAIRDGVPAEYREQMVTEFPANKVFDTAARFGGNIVPPAYWNGVIAYRDLAMQAEINVHPWGFYLSPDYDSQRAENSGGIPGIDFGCLHDDWRPGAAYPSGFNWSAQTFRVDDKKFRATRLETPGQNEITFSHVNGSPYMTLGWGRYAGWTGAAAVFSDGGTDGYAEFQNDDTKFWSYSYQANYPAHLTAPVYYSIWVENGTFQVYDGDPDNGGVLRRDDVTSADNGSEWPCEFDSGYIFIRRKSGSTGPHRLRRYRAYIKGADITQFGYTLPSKSFAFTASLISNPGAQWEAGLNLAGKLTYDDGTGFGSINFVPSTDQEYSRPLIYTGYNDDPMFPPGGLDCRVRIDEASYDSGTVWNQHLADDLVTLGVRGIRTLDWQATNGAPIWKTTGIDRAGGPTGPQRELHPTHLGTLANLAGLQYVWNSIPGHWDEERFVDFHDKLDESAPSRCEIYFEPPNETWNFGYPGYRYAEKQAESTGLDVIEVYAEWMHDYLDWLEPTGRLGTRFIPIVAWGQHQISEELYARMMNRGREGVPLWQRLADANGKFSVGCYFGDSITYQNTNVPPNGIADVVGEDATEEEFHAEIGEQYAAALPLTQARILDVAQWVADFNVSVGLPQNAIPLIIYELNRHGGVYSWPTWDDDSNPGTDDVQNANFKAAWQAFEQGPDMAALQVGHSRFLMERGIGHAWFQAGAGRNPASAQGFWAMIGRTGYDQADNRSATFEAFADQYGSA